MVEAWNTLDAQAPLRYFDESIEYHSAFAGADGAVYYGNHGLRIYRRDLEDAWGAQIRAEIEALCDLGEDTVLAFYVMRGRGLGSEAEVTMPSADVLKWRDDRIVYFKACNDREDALSELDASDDELEPIAP
jgi:hypothetical protein